MANSAIDKVDRSIITLLQRDGRTPNIEIARHLGIAESTVRRRVDRLVREGIISIAAVANPFKVGLPIVALIGVDVELQSLKAVADCLVAMPQVRYVGYSTGAHDLIIEALFPSNEALYLFLSQELAQVNGIQKTETSIQLHIAKRSYEWPLPGDEKGTDAGVADDGESAKAEPSASSVH
jgi:Lrp/AsnC family transcriptional regulator for asnA, asnC and gidA